MNEMDYGLKEMKKMDYDLKEIYGMAFDLKKMNDNMTNAEVIWGWAMKPWWNVSVTKSITEQTDD